MAHCHGLHLGQDRVREQVKAEQAQGQAEEGRFQQQAGEKEDGDHQ